MISSSILFFLEHLKRPIGHGHAPICEAFEIIFKSSFTHSPKVFFLSLKVAPMTEYKVSIFVSLSFMSVTFWRTDGAELDCPGFDGRDNEVGRRHLRKTFQILKTKVVSSSPAVSVRLILYPLLEVRGDYSMPPKLSVRT